jgi:hypothetical protein
MSRARSAKKPLAAIQRSPPETSKVRPPSAGSTLSARTTTASARAEELLLLFTGLFGDLTTQLANDSGAALAELVVDSKFVVKLHTHRRNYLAEVFASIVAAKDNDSVASEEARARKNKWNDAFYYNKWPLSDADTDNTGIPTSALNLWRAYWVNALHMPHVTENIRPRCVVLTNSIGLLCLLLLRR